MALENPFVFDRPLEDGRELVGREREVAEFTEAIGIGIELDDLLHVHRDVAVNAGARALVCFDDVQDALAIKGIADAVATARQQEERRVAYVFAGSNLSLLAEQEAERPPWGKRP